MISALKKMSFFIICLSLWALSVPELSIPNPGIPEAAGAENPDSLAAKGREHYEKGEPVPAGVLWEKALEMYHPDQSPGKCLDTAMYLAGVYRMTGYRQKALTLLHRYLPTAEQSSDADRRALFFSTLSDIYLSLGEISRAAGYAEKAVASGQKAENPLTQARVLLEAGNVMAADGNWEGAADAYGESLAIADADEGKNAEFQTIKSKVLLNAARLTFFTGASEDCANALEYAAFHISEMPDSLDKARDLTALALLLRDIRNTGGPPDQEADRLAYRSLESARKIAEKYNNTRLRSQTCGYTGELYEKQNRSEDALRLSRSAVFFAHQGNHPDLLYLWQWQIGRIREAMGEEKAALQAYSDAVNTLTPIRKMLFSGYRSQRDTFSESIRPVYLAKAGLLLRQAAETEDASLKQEKLRQTRDTMEKLKSAELADYFEDECVSAAENSRETPNQSPEHTAFLYPVMLPERLEILLTLPDGMDQVRVSVGADELTASAIRFRHRLQTRPNNRFLQEAREMYHWLIRPLEDRLKAHQIETLVIAPDGALRQIPFTALHDGAHFLIEKYAIATVPSMRLTAPGDMGTEEHPDIFLGGISEAVQDFSPLPSVTAELKDIKQIMGGQVLLENKDYTLENLTRYFKNNEYSIVHLATHGVFGGSPDESFILTYDDKMTMDGLETLIRYGRFRKKQVQLLTLSACQTALGDERAALGLAGVAVKAGVRTALATLWYVDDEATSLAIREFYRQLQKPGLSKAAALQNAQKELIRRLRFRHPAYWSPFLLIGNWM